MNDIVRDDSGRFVKGHSGNPAGKAKGIRNQMTLERLAFEKALRDYVHDPRQAEKLVSGIDRLLGIAQFAEKDSDAISAMKLMLDRVMPNMPPQVAEEASKTDNQLKIVIQTNPNAKAPVNIINAETGEIEE